MEEELLLIECSKCGKKYKVKSPIEKEKHYRCKKCNNIIVVEPSNQVSISIFKFIDEKGKEIEVFNYNDLKKYIENGQIDNTTLIFNKKYLEWKKADQIVELRYFFPNEKTEISNFNETEENSNIEEKTDISDEKKQSSDYCPFCKEYDNKIGFCYKIKINVRNYPKKFSEKCNGNFFEKDIEKEKLSKAASEDSGDHKNEHSGYGLGYFYAIILIFLSVIHLFNSLVIISQQLNIIFDSSIDIAVKTEYITIIIGNFIYIIFLLFASLAIFKKYKRVAAFIYIITILWGLQVLIRGIIPYELILWFIFTIPFIVYFRNRKELLLTEKLVTLRKQQKSSTIL